MVSRNITKSKGNPPLTIAEAARRLGVTKPHLWHVVKGNRISHSLLARYEELKAKHTTQHTTQ